MKTRTKIEQSALWFAIEFLSKKNKAFFHSYDSKLIQNISVNMRVINTYIEENIDNGEALIVRDDQGVTLIDCLKKLDLIAETGKLEKALMRQRVDLSQMMQHEKNDELGFAAGKNKVKDRRLRPQLATSQPLPLAIAGESYPGVFKSANRPIKKAAPIADVAEDGFQFSIDL